MRRRRYLVRAGGNTRGGRGDIRGGGGAGRLLLCCWRKREEEGKMCDALSSVGEEAYSLYCQHRYGKINGYDEFERKVQETEGGDRLIWQGYHLSSLFYSPKKEDKEKAKHLGVSFTAELLSSEELDSNSHLQYLMGWCYNNSIGVEENDDEAFRFFSMASEGGLVIALSNLGFCYSKRIGVDQDRAMSDKLYRRAAIAGHAPAQFNLALQYYYGDDAIMQNYDEAVKWFRAAAEQGFAPAQCMLGECYSRGFGVELDMREAISWYELSANGSDPRAQFSLGLLYRSGRGVNQDHTEALHYFQLAADQGYAAAQNTVGVYLLQGIGGSTNFEKAVEWFRLAAAQGHSSSFNHLGWCYENGFGVGKDVLEAVKWYQRAKENNVTFAAQKLEDLKEPVKEAIWQSRKDFLVFLAQYQFISRPSLLSTSCANASQDTHVPITPCPYSSIIHKVFYIDEMRREIMSFL